MKTSTVQLVAEIPTSAREGGDVENPPHTWSTWKGAPPPAPGWQGDTFISGDIDT